jgi:hypothetical protein
VSRATNGSTLPDEGPLDDFRWAPADGRVYPAGTAKPHTAGMPAVFSVG